MSKFTDAIEKNLSFEGITSNQLSPGFCYTCEDCRTDHGFCCEHSAKAAYDAGEVSEEGHFSWNSCECCGSGLSGDRYAAHALIDGEIYHYEVCQDCLLFLANGDEPVDGPWMEEGEG